MDRAAPAANADLEPGRYARLTIGDTGHGMDKGTLEHIFDPFYTRKKSLGMGVRQSILEAGPEGSLRLLYIPAGRAVPTGSRPGSGPRSRFGDPA